LFAIVASSSFAQVSATASASASATVIEPLLMTKTADLAFGKMVAGQSAGTVIIDTDGARTATGGVTLISAGSVQNAAAFDITGYDNAAIAIALPASITIETAGGDNQMTVDTFTSSLGDTSTLSADGTATLNVGASLSVAADQAVGLYTGSFDVTVAYN
jgi:hypothetical protein